MELYDERICRYSLNRIFGYAPKTAAVLIRHFGSAAELYRTGGKRLQEALPFTKGIDRICDTEYESSAKELESLEAKGFRFIGSDSPHYPSRLLECDDYPIGLYIRSENALEDIFSDRTYIAVIGTRDLSPYGNEWCRRIVSVLSDSKDRTTVVSGLAIGTDITAHRAAIESGTPTISVIPTGIDSIYPHRHRADACRIASMQGGAIITDFPPGTSAIKLNFLRRNRIIAGLCKATVLVESKIKGGGMMTARLAFSYDRDVFALPGRAGDLRSQGCNLLIKEKIAEPIISEYSFAESLGISARQPCLQESKEEMISRLHSGSMNSDDIRLMARILLKIKQQSGICISEIAEECGIPYHHAAELTGLLECDGLISTDLMRRCSINV